MKLKNNILIIDNFLPEPKARRQLALSSVFQPEMTEGVTYPGISKITDALLINDDLRRISQDTPITYASTANFFRLTREDDKLPTFIHNDAGLAQVTGVLYLNETEQALGGTAFWSHKKTKTRGTKGLNPEDMPGYQKDGIFENRWVLEQLIPMRFNRLVLFPSDLWHSPYPRSGFGENVSSGRLIQVYFFNEIILPKPPDSDHNQGHI